LSGRLSDEETLKRIRSASIFAMPSLQEGLGLSLQEALFHGCVAVGSRAGGIPELIDDNLNGILVPPADMPALSAALDKLMSDQALLQRLRKETRTSILRKGMLSKAMVQKYLDDYRQLMRRKE
jgi:glycosyltransferase involved in cell wall biosynthesis